MTEDSNKKILYSLLVFQKNRYALYIQPLLYDNHNFFRNISNIDTMSN